MPFVILVLTAKYHSLYQKICIICPRNEGATILAKEETCFVVYVESGNGVVRHRFYRILLITLFDFEGGLDSLGFSSKNDFMAKSFA